MGAEDVEESEDEFKEGVGVSVYFAFHRDEVVHSVCLGEIFEVPEFKGAEYKEEYAHKELHETGEVGVCLYSGDGGEDEDAYKYGDEGEEVGDCVFFFNHMVGDCMVPRLLFCRVYG